jgi:DNA-binding MarR family transcriptional regulator
MASDFVTALGPAFTAHRLRRLSDAFVESCGAWLAAQGIKAPPRAASTLRLLASEAPLAVTEIAAKLRLSHPFIIRILKELERLGLLEIARDAKDGRRRLVSLTRGGQREAERLERTAGPIAAAYASLFDDAGIDLPSALAALEAAHGRRNLAERLAAISAQ